jgi:hypothetical protein
MESQVRKHFGAAATVAAVCVLALVLRWRGLEHSLPHLTFRDGYHVFAQVELMRAHDPHPELHPFWEVYPHLVSRLVAAMPDPNAASLPDGADLAANLQRAAAPWMQIREVSVLLSLLAVFACYGIARAFLSRGWSLLAAALVAGSLLEIFYAQQEKCHGAAAGTATLAVLGAMYVRRRPTIAGFLIGGATAALAIGALQSGVAVLCASLAAVVLAWRQQPAVRKRIALGCGLALALVGLAIVAFYPFVFSDRSLVGDPNADADAQSGDWVVLSGHGVDLAQLNGRGFVVILETLISFEPVALGLALVGLVALLIRARRRSEAAQVDRGDLWVVLAYVVPYTCAVGIYGLSYERFAMPLVPFLAVLAAAGARALAELATPRGASSDVRRVLHGSIAAVTLAPALALAWKLGSVRAADDTYQQAAAWISEHCEPERDRIDVLPYLDLPVFYADDAMRENLEVRKDQYWLMWQSRLQPQQRAGRRYSIYMPKGAKETRESFGHDPLSYLRSQGVDYVVLQQVSEEFRYKVMLRTATALREGAQEVARFTPLEHDTGEAAKLAIGYSTSAFVRPFFVHLLSLRCEGPTLEIYRVAKQE